MKKAKLGASSSFQMSLQGNRALGEGVCDVDVKWYSKRERTFEEIALNASFLSSQFATWAAETNLCPRCTWLPGSRAQHAWARAGFAVWAQML